jgi:hypothetical protein
MMSRREACFRLVARSWPYEVRDYPERTVAQIDLFGDRRECGNVGYEHLKRYFAGKNIQKCRLGLTDPIAQTRIIPDPMDPTPFAIQTPENGPWRVSLCLPANTKLVHAPTPMHPDICVRTLQATTLVAMAFSGLTVAHKVARYAAELKRVFANRDDDRPQPAATVARYGSPWTLWFLRKNEMWLPLTQLAPTPPLVDFYVRGAIVADRGGSKIADRYHRWE